MNPLPTLELTLQRKTDSGYPVIAALTRPGGFLPLRREGMLNLDIPALTELQYEPLAYGTALGQALFVDEIRDTFREGLSGGESLRVLLSIEAPDLRALDWHRLAAPFAGRWRFLAAQQNTPFSLAVPSPASAHFPALGRRDLRVLLLVAGPESLSGDYKLAPFDVAATIASIQAALGDIPCDILEYPSLDALCAALTQTPYTLLHLVCHGAVNERGETILYFPKDEKRGPTPASDLLDRLASLARLPHFAFIAACESALPQNGLGSLAGRLVRELGLPAVLAMTDRVSIATAGAIAAPFYAHLYQHGQPDLALAQSLAGLQGAHDLTVPALLSRLGDRPLFDDNTERALTEKELDFGLAKLAESLPERAPVMDSLRDSLTRRLRSTLGANSKSLSESSRTERKETLDQLNSLSLEALDLSFNALCLGQTPPAYDSHSPFRGLESFRPEDAKYFFGRETLTRKLLQKLNEHNFLAVLGASGSGKSSLVMAGLIPALNVSSAIFRPGAEPLSELDKALQAGPQLLVVDQFEELFTLSAREQRSDFISRLLEQSHRLRVVITLRADFLGEVAPFKSLKEEVQSHQEIIPPMDEAELRRAMEGQAGCAGLRFESDLSQQMLDDVSGEPGAMPLLQHALWTLWMRRHGRWLRANEYRAFGGVKQAIASTAEAVYARCTEFERERLRDIFLRLTRLDESADGRDTRRRVLLRNLVPAKSDPASTVLLVKQLADARLMVVSTTGLETNAQTEVEVAHEALIRHWERLRTWLNDDRNNLRLRDEISDEARRWENSNHDEALLNHRGPRLELALEMRNNPLYSLNPTEQAYLEACVDLGKREKAATIRRKQYTIVSVSFALVVIMSILVGWGWSSNENSKQLSYQVATSRAANATAGNETNIRATAQSNAEHANATAESETSIRAIAQSNAENAKATAQSNEKIAKNAQATAEYSAAYADSGALKALAISNLSTNYTLSMLFGSESFRILQHYGLAQDKEPDILLNLLQKSIPNLQESKSELGEVHQVLFSPNGSLLITAGDGGIMLRDTSDLHNVKDLKLLSDKAVNAIAFNQDGSIFAAGGSDGIVIMWDVATFSQIMTIPGNGDITSLSFSSDKKTLAVAGDGRIILWKLNGTTDYQRIKSISDGPITLVAFRPINQSIVLVSGGEDGYFRFWDLGNPYEPASISTRNIFFTSTSAIAFNGAYLALGWENGEIQIYDCSNPQNLYRLNTISTNRELESVAISADNRIIAAGGTNGSIYLYDISDIRTPQLIKSLSSHTEQIYSIAFHSQGHYLASGGKDKATVLWDISQNQFSPLWRSVPFEGVVNAVAFNSQKNILAVSDAEKKTHLWDMSDFNNPKELPYFFTDALAQNIVFNPDGSRIATFDDYGVVSVWNTDNLAVHPDNLHEFKVGSIQFLAFGKDVLFVNQGTKGIFDISSKLGARSQVFPFGGNFCTNSVATTLSADDTLLAMGDCDLNIWDITGRNQPHLLANKLGLSSNVESIAISSDKKLLATGHLDNSISLWDISQPQMPCLLSSTLRVGHTRSVSSLAFSSDGKTLASGSVDENIILWDISDPNAKPVLRAILGGHTAPILHQALYFSNDGFSLISASSKEVIVWNLDPQFWLEKACKIAGRNFTQSEWAQYLPGESYRATCLNLPLEP